MSTITFCCINHWEDWLTCRAVSQVYPYVDEILIGDDSLGGDLIKLFLSGVPKAKWIPLKGFEEYHISKRRNYVQSFANSEWLLWQDPDELYPLEILRNLKKWAETLNVEAMGFYRCNWKSRERLEYTLRVPKIRFFKNLERILWVGRVHEHPIGYMSSKILDYNYHHDVHWLSPLALRVYRSKDRLELGELHAACNKVLLESYAKCYPDKERRRIIRSRE